jgi:hypothetical protein
MVFNSNYFRLYRPEKKNNSGTFKLRSAKNPIAPPSCAYVSTFGHESLLAVETFVVVTTGANRSWRFRVTNNSCSSERLAIHIRYKIWLIKFFACTLRCPITYKSIISVHYLSINIWILPNAMSVDSLSMFDWNSYHIYRDILIHNDNYFIVVQQNNIIGYTREYIYYIKCEVAIKINRNIKKIHLQNR